MRHYVLPSLIALLLLVPGPINARTTLITGGHLFDGRSELRVENPGILIQRGRILAVGQGSDRIENAKRIRLEYDQTILPGFIDLHAHYHVDLFQAGRVDETEAYPLMFLGNGVTTTFPGGEKQPEKMRALRLAINRGERIGPRILNSGPYFGSARPGWEADRSAGSIHQEVHQLAEQGTAGFKAKNPTRDELAALIDAAHQQGLTVTGHLNSGVGDSVNPKDAILMGIDRVEHFLGGDTLKEDRHAYLSWKHVDTDSKAFRDIVDLYIDHGVYFSATLAAFGAFGQTDSPVFEDFADEQRFLTDYAREHHQPREADDFTELADILYWVKKDTLKAFYDAGGGHLITLSTDHPFWGEYTSPFYIHREMQAMVRAGLPEHAVLRIATLNSARAIGMGDQLGSIEPGKWADLVIVDGNPLEDITHTRNVRHVMKAGQWHNAEDLIRQAEGRIGPRSEEGRSYWMPRANEAEE
ncbi:amidohydrolase family protein [Natronospira bacteriovora]|uniref:Amidohydrolase family protein n=1 Tax=Natronospira bacteriovora TaxID=3069753 RepID=A0ABU0W9E4_9GAMM|nr:amidohydrolase family protein [Natronospira sp. AB-CW4]MDQ2070659.1 amidohydrolase family protein [Natronospira sp. AB-CW4]